ncbi:MAG TPA: DUF6431 domain-containing protein [Syntrophomonadaceae bacterium]|nr:DUF6431 domain-containing protein [Syntrophomonadaceae bacterium]
MFSVRSLEQIPCPCCRGGLKVIGSRKRSCINTHGNKIVLSIRRLRCADCKRIHHELPDILVPYKHHVRESIETTITEERQMSVIADESTLKRWQNWFFERADYFQGCLTSIILRYHLKESVGGLSSLPPSKLHRIWQHVGDAPGWLARVVKPIANLNLWPHTRSAFCP